MKRILEVGDIIRVTSANNSYYGYDVEITEVTNKMAKGKEVLKDGRLSMLGVYRFNKNYDDSDLKANIYGNDPFDCWNRLVIPKNIEVWRKIPRFEDAYEVSQFGRVRNFKTNHILKPYTSKSHRHPQVMLRLNNEFREQHGVSHLVMAAFSIDRYPLVCVGFGDKVVFHRDKNIENNSLLNLYVVKK